MNITEILCPYCRNSHLREIKLPPQSINSVWGDEAKKKSARVFYMCLSCTKMLSEEELNI
jgi:DNA-directed RNA polymerase subunit RPC12/RpoP